MALALVVGTWAAYANTIRAPFVYDDAQSITENESIRQLWPLSRVLLPLSERGLTVSGRPILNLSFALNYLISGTEVWSYHVFNILIHAAAGLLLFGIVRRTLASVSRGLLPTWRRAAIVAGIKPDGLAFAVSALWLLHPLQTQAVTYTVQRAESLMGFFYLLTLYAFVRAVDVEGMVTVEPRNRASSGGAEERASGRTNLRWTIVCIVACALGMGTKEVMATAPLLILLYDRTFVGGSFRAAWRHHRGIHLGLAATWLVLAAGVASTGWNRGGTVGMGVDVPLWAYPLTQFQALVRYLALSLWPQPLVFEDGTFWVHHAADLLAYLGIVLPLLVATIIALVRAPLLGFLGAWFFAILAPTSLAPGTIQMIVEHRMYLPLAAITVALAVSVHTCAGRRGPTVMAGIALAAGTLTYLRNGDYRSHFALWTDTVAKRPLNPRAREGLAEAYAELGNHAAAVREYTAAAQLQPGESTAHFNLARALGDAGKIDDSIRHYENSLQLKPNEPRAHNNLAVALARQGRSEAAAVHYLEAQRLAPNEPEFFYNHGLLLARSGRQNEALEKFERALKLKPASPDLNLTMAEAFAAARKVESAVECYEAVVRVDPGNALARFRLADLLLDLDRPTQAILHYETGLRVRPDHAEAHHNLGTAYARSGRWSDARREFETALRLKPDYADARRNLDQLRTLLDENRD